MKIEVNVSKKYFFTILTTVIVLAGILAVYAYNANSEGGNPAVMGHSADEIMVNLAGENTSLSTAINSLSQDREIGSSALYESEWIKVNTTVSRKIMFNHNLGFTPQNYQVLFSANGNSNTSAINYYYRVLQLADCSWFRCFAGSNLSSYAVLATSDSGASKIYSDYNGVELMEGSHCSSDWVKARLVCIRPSGEDIYPVTPLKPAYTSAWGYSNPVGMSANETSINLEIAKTYVIYSQWDASQGWQNWNTGYYKVVVYG